MLLRVVLIKLPKLNLDAADQQFCAFNVPGEHIDSGKRLDLGRLDPMIIESMFRLFSHDWRRLKDHDAIVFVVVSGGRLGGCKGIIRHQLVRPYRSTIAGGDLANIGGGVQAIHLHIFVQHARDDLDTLEGGRQDDNIAAGGVRGEANALDTAHRVRVVARIHRTRQHLVAAHFVADS